jgi:hypothetical protein
VPAGDDASTVVLFKDGLAVGDCTGPAGIAAPDPCIDARATLPDGDVELTILTSSASTWAAGVPGPTLGAIAMPVGSSRVGAAVAAGATVTDGGALGGHLATFDWGDGTTSAGSIPAGATGSALVSASHAYATSGLFTVTLTVTDPSGQSATSTPATVVVFDPTWTVAGSGTVVPGGPTSVSGDNLPGLDGSTKASVALDLRYKKGAANPTGIVTLTYKALGFAMSAADWLVVTEGSRARIAGRGTVAGQSGSHPFRLDVVDGNLTAPKRTDRWILRVWAPGADPDTAPPMYQASGEVKGNLTLKR